MTRKVLIAAHPDDEVIFFPAQIMDEIIIVYEGRSDKPLVVDGRRRAKRGHPLASSMSYISIEESLYWKDPSRIAEYEQGKQQLREKLSGRFLELKDADIFTHNCQGEYGHKDHILVNNVVVGLFGDTTRIYTPSTDKTSDIHIESDPSLVQRVKDHYSKYNCWTWRRDFVAPSVFHLKLNRGHEGRHSE